MDIQHLVLAVVANEPKDSSLGRTLLQKKMYFLNEMLNKSIDFYPHYYGPYSRKVADTVDSLVSASILKERVESFPSVSTPWGDYTRYSYVLPEKVQKTINDILKNRLGENQYNIVQEKLKKINEYSDASDYKLMSIASKVLQILKIRGALNLKDFSKEAAKLKWNLKQSQVKRAAQFLTYLNLLAES